MKSEWAEEVEGSKSIPKMLPAVWNCIMAVPVGVERFREHSGKTLGGQSQSAGGWDSS